MKFDHELLRWHLTLIRVAERLGEQETVQRAARTALELASRGPRLARHPSIGVVRTDLRTIRRLRRLAR
jgi:plasmid stabilization system protein ParE